MDRQTERGRERDRRTQRWREGEGGRDGQTDTEGGRGREREGDRDTEREGERDTERDRWREGGRETDTETEGERDRHREGREGTWGRERDQEASGDPQPCAPVRSDCRGRCFPARVLEPGSRVISQGRSSPLRMKSLQRGQAPSLPWCAPSPTTPTAGEGRAPPGPPRDGGEG